MVVLPTAWRPCGGTGVELLEDGMRVKLLFGGRKELNNDGSSDILPSTPFHLDPSLQDIIPMNGGCIEQRLFQN